MYRKTKIGWWLFSLALVVSLVIVAAIILAPLAEAQTCMNARLCAERGMPYGTDYGRAHQVRQYRYDYYRPRHHYHVRPPYYYGGGYYHQRDNELIAGGLEGVVWRGLESVDRHDANRTAKEIAAMDIHARSAENARPGTTKVRSPWGGWETEHDPSGGNAPAGVAQPRREEFSSEERQQLSQVISEREGSSPRDRASEAGFKDGFSECQMATRYSGQKSPLLTVGRWEELVREHQKRLSPYYLSAFRKGWGGGGCSFE